MLQPRLTACLRPTERKSKSSRDAKGKAKRKVSVWLSRWAFGPWRVTVSSGRTSAALSLSSPVEIPARTPSLMDSAAPPCLMTTAATLLKATWGRTRKWSRPSLQVRWAASGGRPCRAVGGSCPWRWETSCWRLQPFGAGCLVLTLCLLPIPSTVAMWFPPLANPCGHHAR